MPMVCDLCEEGVGRSCIADMVAEPDPVAVFGSEFGVEKAWICVLFSPNDWIFDV